MAFVPGSSQIVFSFDTTGSMSSVLFEVRGRLNDMIQRLQADIPGIQIAVFAHGDYCDAKEFYVTKHVDFTDNVPELCEFVNEVSGTGGGDTDECYELVLREAQGLSWAPHSQKSLVMIGDAMPHAADYPLNTDNIDWKEEVDALAAKGVKIYGVQCLDEPGADEFYRALSEKTGGRHIKLSEFRNIFDFLMAICYREKGSEFLNCYENEVRARTLQTGLDDDLEGLFGALRDPIPAPLTPPGSVLVDKPVPGPAAGVPVIPGPAAPCPPAPRPVIRRRVPKPRRIAPAKQRKTELKRGEHKRLDRKNVPHSNFLLNDLVWSPWKLVISGDNDSGPSWRKRNGTSSYRRKLVFPDTRQRAVYEFSLQERKGARRRVVFFKVVEGFAFPARWETRLLRAEGVREEISSAVSRGCRIFVRRAALKRSQGVRDFRRRLRNLYNYAWI